MRNFRRALRLTFRYPYTLVGVVFCSLMVAVFWGGNIGALYPIVEVAMRGKPLQSWVDDEIAKAEQTARDLQAEIDTLKDAESPETGDDSHRVEREILETRLKAEQAALETARWIRPYIYRYCPADPFQTMVLIVAALMAATVVKNFFLFSNNMLVERVVQLVAFDLRKDLYEHTLRMDLCEFDDERTGSMLSRFNMDLGFLLKGLRCLFGKAIREPLKGIVCLAGAAFISWRLLAFSLLLTPVAALLIRSLGGSIKRANRRAMEENAQLLGVLSEAFNGMQTVKAFTMENFERVRFLRVSKECLRKAMKIMFYGSLAKPATEILGMGVVFTALLAGAYLILNQETHVLGIKLCDRPLSIPALLCFYGLLIGTSDPARRLSELFGSIQGGVAAADRIFPMLDQRPVVQDPANPQPTPRPHRQLVFRNVDFRYTPDQLILQDLNFTVPFGETLCIVGPNGCGKSTLVNLLPRFHDPSGGSVCLDEVDLRQLRLRDLRRSVGVVTQQTILFDDTVFNNIRYGSMRATREQVITAARKAHAHRFVEEKLEKGYETVVGPGGNRLSGGQRQRIALARAILRDPDILILDEATSQIDIESEQQIHEALKEFVRERTAIIITHRLSTLDLADRILVLDKGRVADIGTHAELMGRCALYQRLQEIQLRQSA
jgi:ATP-binding cassette subfamily B protein/subfamily B ATP-binding cassette protein MsbA